MLGGFGRFGQGEAVFTDSVGEVIRDGDGAVHEKAQAAQDVGVVANGCLDNVGLGNHAAESFEDFGGGNFEEAEFAVDGFGGGLELAGAELGELFLHGGPLLGRASGFVQGDAVTAEHLGVAGHGAGNE